MARKPGLDSMSSSRVSSMCASLDAGVDEFRTGPLGWQRWCYLWLDATWVRCRVEGGSVSQAAAAAIALGEDGCKHFCGADAMDTEGRADWDRFLANLGDRGLDGARLVVSDAHGGLKRAAAERFQGASWQRCYVHLMRDVAGRARQARPGARRRAPEGRVRAARPAGGAPDAPPGRDRTLTPLFRARSTNALFDTPVQSGQGVAGSRQAYSRGCGKERGAEDLPPGLRQQQSRRSSALGQLGDGGGDHPVRVLVHNNGLDVLNARKAHKAVRGRLAGVHQRADG